MLAAALWLVAIAAVTTFWVLLDRMLCEEERVEREHHRDLLREVRRHGDT